MILFIFYVDKPYIASVSQLHIVYLQTLRACRYDSGSGSYQTNMADTGSRLPKTQIITTWIVTLFDTVEKSLYKLDMVCASIISAVVLSKIELH